MRRQGLDAMPSLSFFDELFCGPLAFNLMSQQDCLVAFGSNVGDSDRCYRDVYDAWDKDPRFESLVCSELITTQPVGSKDQSVYRNGCLRFWFDGTADDLFRCLQATEQQFGESAENVGVPGRSIWICCILAIQLLIRVRFWCLIRG